MVHHCRLLCCLAAGLVLQTLANGHVFLGSREQHLSLHSHGPSDLLAELERALGQDQRQATERRVKGLEDALRPMFLAMPKDDASRLNSAGVRYLLHRLFVQRHGWLVNGLQPQGENWNTSSPALLFKDTFGDDVHKAFNHTLSSAGFSLRQVAVFAATLENLVHNDNVRRLEVAYDMLGISPTEDDLSEEKAAMVIDAYMKMYVLALDHNSLEQSMFTEASESILAIYPTWPDTEVFAREVRESVLAEVPAEERTNWKSTLRVLEEVGERYGRWQNKECSDLKKALVEMEDPGTGRIPLARFYGSTLENQTFLFTESVPYLRQLGALDESDSKAKSVIIPNYLYSPSNCVASSTFYSVCCIDECENLLGVLEHRVGAPHATPDEISQIIAGLESDTVSAPRMLSSSLRSRLAEIAAHHKGKVPLHGRLFAQWMHHAYPRECPYPHLSGTTRPLGAMAFEEETGESTEITPEQIKDLISESKKSIALEKTMAAGEPDLPWSAEEELFVYHERPAFALGTLSGAHQAVAVLAAGCSMALGLWRLHQQGSGLSSDVKMQKLYV